MIDIVEGAFDLHVHSAPDLFPRIADDLRTIRDCACKGFAGVCLKNHFEGTTSRAQLAMQTIPGIKVYGGLVLNHYVGGINPYAVQAALKLGASIIWMPTIDAACHRAVHGTGDFPAQSSGLESPKRGISILKEGKLIEEAREIVALVKQRRAALATGHLSFDEIRALLAEADSQGLRKIILTHPYDKAPGLTLEQVKQLAGPSVRIEFVFCSITPKWNFTDAATIAHCIKTIGPRHFVISSDGGQAHNPMPADGYHQFINALHSEGIAEDDFTLMCRENPHALLED